MAGPHPKNARTSSSSPRAWATSDRSGFIGNQGDMAFQFDWAGNKLINKRILVLKKELDRPQPQFRTLKLPPDPLPIINARVEPYSIDEANPASTQLTQNAAFGDTTLNVQDSTGFTVGTVVYVYLDNGGFFITPLLTVGTGTLGLTNPVNSAASINKIVCAAGANDV